MKSFKTGGRSKKRLRRSLTRRQCTFQLTNKEIRQIDILIELEDKKITELKEALQKKNELNSNEFKRKIEEIDQLEFKKTELKDQNNKILDNIEGLEEQKENLQSQLYDLKTKIINNVKIKKKLKDKEINERKKQSEIKDQLYEKKRHMDSLQDDVTTKAKEVQELKRLLSKLNNETQDFEDSKVLYDNISVEKDIEAELKESKTSSSNCSLNFTLLPGRGVYFFTNNFFEICTLPVPSSI